MRLPSVTRCVSHLYCAFLDSPLNDWLFTFKINYMTLRINNYNASQETLDHINALCYIGCESSLPHGDQVKGTEVKSLLSRFQI